MFTSSLHCLESKPSSVRRAGAPKRLSALGG